ncbi:MAG: hypothetical protein NTV34_13765 [Proteobacteria bacterium]|nr:hypothetical protein [Pseudomonadota bacterium]
MNVFSILLLLATLSQTALAGQNWACEGENNNGDAVLVVFETKSNTVIAQILAMKGGLIVSRINSQVRRNTVYRPTRYNGFNGFSLSVGQSGLTFLLPKNLDRLDDEFTAYLQDETGGSSGLNTVVLTCTGAG